MVITVATMTEPVAHPTSTITQPAVTSCAPWKRYQRPYVRDLAYVLACPNVLTKWLNLVPHQVTQTVMVHPRSFWYSQYEAYSARLEELDTTSAYQKLTRYLLARPSPSRLGFHFEGLLSFWLEDGFAHDLHPYEILASNVQLYQGKQTTGELDLILYNHQHQLTEHWELAIKFFMGSYPFDPVNWVGINANDNLARKMTHMQTKQLRVLWVDTPNHGQVKIDKRYAIIKGRFFLPLHYQDFIYPDWLAPHFPLHEWCDKQDVAGLASLDKSDLRRAHYIEWFTKRDFYDGKQKYEAGVDWETSVPATGLYFENDRPIVIYFKQRK